MIQQFLLTMLLLLIFDVVWLTANAPTSRALFAAIQGSPLEIRWIPTTIAYILLGIGLVAFVILPALSMTDAALKGILYGLIVYGVYDMTNYATLTKYTLRFSVIDILWGCVLCGTTAATVKFLFDM